MEIKKAIITAAGPAQRTLPLQTLVDRDGVTKTALRILIEEVRAAGIEEICVVTCPGDPPAYAAAAGDPGAQRLGVGDDAVRAHQADVRRDLGVGHARDR
ncbi:MAG TPA: hypothetical protein PK942_09155, partial [Verrucomicrobiota bacterium]|nr:hypothetical protein [Verrucomicrobiota bacterium]